MAVLFLRSSAVGSNNGTTWANAYTSVLNALTSAVPGDVIYMAKDHRQVVAGSFALVAPNHSSATAMIHIWRVDHLTGLFAPSRTDDTPLTIANNAADANLQASGGLGSILIERNIAFHGVFLYAWVNFITFGGQFDQAAFVADRCSIVYGAASAGSFQFIWQAYMRVTDCTFASTTFNTGNSLRAQSATDWRFEGCQFVFPTVLSTGWVRNLNGFGHSRGRLIDCDFTDVVSGAQLIDTVGFDNGNRGRVFDVAFQNCMLPENYVFVGTNGPDNVGLRLVIEDCRAVGTATPQNIKEDLFGDVASTPSVYLTDTVENGGDDLGYRVDTRAGAITPHFPMPAIHLHRWLVAGTYDITIEMLDGNSVNQLLDGNTCWMQLHYFDTANGVARKVDTDTREVQTLAAFTLLPDGVGVGLWTGGGTRKSVRLTQQIAIAKDGMLSVTVFVGRDQSGRFHYINPRIIAVEVVA